MSCLENLPNVALICLLKHMNHDAKLNLRQTSQRMFEMVTALDKTFNYWTFDPCMKEDLPEFVLDSDKSFQIHIKDLSVRNDDNSEGDNESTEDYDDEECNEEVQRVVKFINKHAQRIVSFKLSGSMNIDEFGVTQDTLDELAATKPKWTYLKSFTVLNTDVDLENSDDGVSDMSNVGVEDLAKILKFCSNSLENLVLVGVETCRINNLHLEKLKSLVMIACSDSEDFLTGLAQTGNFLCLEKIHMTKMSEDVDISDFLSTDLSKLKSLEMDHAYIDCEDDEPLHSTFPNLRSIKLKFRDSAQGIEDFLILCSPTLEVLDIESGADDIDTHELDFEKLAVKSWKIKKMKLNLRNSTRCLLEYDLLEDFLNNCPFLEELILESGGNYGYDSLEMNDDYDLYYTDDLGRGPWYWETIDEFKGNVLMNFSLKYLSCPTYYLRSFNSASCEQVVELHLKGVSDEWIESPYCINQDDKFEVVKFPVLNSLTLKDTTDDENRILVSILFEGAQVKESTKGPVSGLKYEKAFSNSTVSST